MSNNTRLTLFERWSIVCDQNLEPFMKHSTHRKFVAVFGCLLTAAVAVFALSDPGISVSQSNEQATVNYNGKQVWSGPVKGTLVGRSSNINGVEQAAAFDGDKVLWENVPGAAEHLKANAAHPAGLEHQQVLKEHQKTVAEQKRFVEEHQKKAQSSAGSSGGSSSRSSSISTSTKSSSTSSGGAGGGNVKLSCGNNATVERIDGKTTLSWNGKTANLGKTKGQLSIKSSQANGAESLTVLEDERVVWESSPGSAKRTK